MIVTLFDIAETKTETGFPKWYAIYPRKKKPRDAEKAYVQALARGVTHQQIMICTQMMLEGDWRGKDPSFIPYPASFLRGGDCDVVQQVKLTPVQPNKLKRDVAELHEHWCKAHGHAWQHRDKDCFMPGHHLCEV